MDTQGEEDEVSIKLVELNSCILQMAISTEILIMIFLLMLAITFGHFLKKSGHKYLQESGLTVLLGMLAGGIL